MNREENIDFCIRYLMQQNHANAPIPHDMRGKKQLLRALMNIWHPQPLSHQFLQAQDAELQAQLNEKTIAYSRQPLWQGDITRLKVDAIVNPANSRGLGCWHPLHHCLDNAIHSAAGLQLRQHCNNILHGHQIATGGAIITPAYNLPAKYVIHTVGPLILSAAPTAGQEEQLASCYRSSLFLARTHHCRSIAFPSISTGEFHFPNRRAAEIALNACMGAPLRVLFIVFNDLDYEIYRQLLGIGEK